MALSKFEYYLWCAVIGTGTSPFVASIEMILRGVEVTRAAVLLTSCVFHVLSMLGPVPAVVCWALEYVYPLYRYGHLFLELA